MGDVTDGLIRYQFTIPNTHLDNTTEILQYYNKWISQVCAIIIHLHVISRLFIVNNFRVKSDYQILIILQSVINVISSLTDIAYCEIQTTNLDYVKIGHPWWNFNKTEGLIVALTMSVSANSTQDFLVLFNLHRLFFFTKPKALTKLYFIALPIMFLSTLGDVYNNYQVVQQGKDIDLFFKYNSLSIVSGFIIFCYIKLRKHFKNNSQYSEKTKKLQEKLSASIMLQLIILVLVALIVYFIPIGFVFIVPTRDYDQFFAYQTMVSLMIVQWYPLISALLITWSITGFFKSTKFPSTVQPFRDKSSSSEAKKPPKFSISKPIGAPV